LPEGFCACVEFARLSAKAGLQPKVED